MNRCEWGLKERTRNRKAFKVGDIVLIYIAGRRELAQHFLAWATIATSSHPSRASVLLDAPDLRGAISSEFKIGLTDIQLFRKPVNIRTILHRLTFIPSKRLPVWWVYLQGGSTRITKKDFLLVSSLAVR